MHEIVVGDRVEALVTQEPYFRRGDTGIVRALNAGRYDHKKMIVDFSENERHFLDGHWYIRPEYVKLINVEH